MRHIRIVFSEEVGEVEGAFDEEGNLLHTWSCNDACWRNEYFEPFMNKLGITVTTSRDKKLIKKLETAWPD